MTQDEIISMAREAGGLVYGSPRSPGTVIDVMFTPETIERFAALVAAKEREACAALCDDIVQEEEGKLDRDYSREGTAEELAVLIRARGQQ